MRQHFFRLALRIRVGYLLGISNISCLYFRDFEMLYDMQYLLELLLLFQFLYFQMANVILVMLHFHTMINDPLDIIFITTNNLLQKCSL